MEYGLFPPEYAPTNYYQDLILPINYVCPGYMVAHLLCSLSYQQFSIALATVKSRGTYANANINE